MRHLPNLSRGAFASSIVCDVMRSLHAFQLTRYHDNSVDIAGELNRCMIGANTSNALSRQVTGEVEPEWFTLMKQPLEALSVSRKRPTNGDLLLGPLRFDAADPQRINATFRFVIWETKNTVERLRDVREQEVFFCTQKQLNDPRFEMYLAAWLSVARAVLKHNHCADCLLADDLVSPDVMDLKRPQTVEDYMVALITKKRLGCLFPRPPGCVYPASVDPDVRRRWIVSLVCKNTLYS